MCVWVCKGRDAVLKVKGIEQVLIYIVNESHLYM